MRLGMFIMPLHDPKGDLHVLIQEDRQVSIEIDRLGYDEVWVGEHYASWTEPIPNPLQFLASLIPVTRNIKFGTAVINLPQHHPAQVAGDAALFDQMSGGRFLMGVGPGGLQSDMELFGTRESNRNEMMLESIDIIHQLWSQDPPYDINGKYWKISLRDTVDMDMGIGPILRPFQKPFPPLTVTAMSPRSATAMNAGSRGWGLISANFIPYENTRAHWDAYSEGAEQAGVAADRGKWSLARSILVADSDAQAQDYLASPNNSVRWYYDYLHHSMSAKNMLGIFKKSPDIPDSDITPDSLVRDIVVSGSPKTVLDKLVGMVDALGTFGGLLVSKKELDASGHQMKSLSLLAEEVMPALRQHVASKAR